MVHDTVLPESWREIPGYAGYYEVSDLGRVRSLARIIDRRDGKLQPVRGRLLRQASLRGGYRRVFLHRDGQRWDQEVHRLVLLAFAGPAPHGHECLYGDGDPSNNCLSNLRWGTRSENRLDAVRHGRHNMKVRDRCPRGHRLIQPNLDPHHLRHGRRTCRACARARTTDWYAVKAGEPSRFIELADRKYIEFMAAWRHCLTPLL